MHFAVARIADFAERCDATLNQNYTRVRVEDQLGRQAVKWDTYKTFEDHNMLLLVTAMEEDELVGFALYLIYVHPHHPDALLAHATFLIVLPKLRGKGVGRGLVEYAIPLLKERGCTHVMHNRRMAYDVKPLFPKLGFEKIEESYIKELK